MLNRVFGNRYKLEEKIGIGGMAEVYKATDEVLGRTVAVKVMLPQYANDPTFAARFKQEAQSAANLQSPFIVNIYDWGQDNVDSTYYIVMEYVRGTDLKTAITQRGAINQRKAAEIGSQVCAALSVAHGYDIVHRDIKPHNIMVQPDGNSKVMDFGIARANGSSMTQTGSVLGTAYYISPEQAQGKPLTSATDLYSLGVVLYEAITGQVPFDAPDAVAVALKQVNEQPTPPSKLVQNMDPELESIVLRALEKDPQARFATAEQMRIALNNYLAGRPVDSGVDSAAQTRVMSAGAALPVINANGVQPPSHTAVMPTTNAGGQPLSMRSAAKAKDEADRKKRGRMIAIGVVAALVSLAAIGLALFMVFGSGLGKIEVPSVVGMTEAEAKTELENAGLKKGNIKQEASSTVEAGRVISSDPSAKTKVDKGTAVVLTISSGPEPPKKVKVPNLKGKTIQEAKALLNDRSLKYERGDDLFDSEVAAGQICGQDIAADTEIDEGSTITFNISKGKERTSVPGVEGESEARAKEILEGQGFVIAITYAESEKVAKGLVVSQDPVIAAMADKGSTVKVVISTGPPQVGVPNVIGKTAADAEAELKAAGFAVSRKDYMLSPEDPAGDIGKVKAQSPSSGSAAKGSTITIEVGKVANN